ncbi:MAG: imidazolonepropionase [candidate division Zixibacteria bacterium]|nr:imidazolonepropionase [candidate division Zixibacteria bacterium]MDH3937440.1 imidazolonepropionase [candidate division Zixibacteria bacterium]
MPLEKKATLLIKNVGQLITMAGAVPRLGPQMKELGLIEDGGIAVTGDEILAVGLSDEIEGRAQLAEGCRVIDACGMVMTPGLIDPHTHPVFSMTREKEFEMRILGKSYMEIAQAGGGIRASVRDLRSSPTELLKQRTARRLDRLLAHGITTIEAKSGYGLSTESEIKQLEIIRDLNLSHPIDMVPTFLGAHEVPDEYRDNRQAYIELVINEMLPKVVSEGLAEFSDIFCEEGVFNVDESRHIQQAAQDAGLGLKFHADELKSTGGAELAASMNAVSADHLVYISDSGISAMADTGTVAVLLPGTTFSLAGSKYAPARTMIESGVVVALSTDCNPGSSHTESMPLIISLAALQMKMTAAEAISAVTVNAACAIKRQDRIGRLDVGCLADMVLWEIDDYRELPYHYGVNLAQLVIKRGKVVGSPSGEGNVRKTQGLKG